jgi:hypothetical protein
LNGSGRAAGTNLPLWKDPDWLLTDTFCYCNANGSLALRVQRYEHRTQRDAKGKPVKAFLQSVPDPERPGRWRNPGNARRVPYNLPALAKALAAQTVVIVEGERCADLLNRWGYIATTNPEGARKGSWRDELTPHFAGRDVVILADNDDDGRRHALEVAAALHDTARRIRVVELPDLPESGDVVDFAANGGTAEQLRTVISSATDWTPSQGQRSAGSAHSDQDEREPAPWPALREAALYGLAGDIVRTILPHTEADLVAVLLNILAYFGNAAGGTPHARVGSKRHALNLYAVYVGATAKGRKGTSMSEVDDLFERVDKDWHDKCVKSGLSSGEGVKYHIRDASEKCTKDGFPIDEGVADKRLLAVESEFASVLKVAAREGNTLSPVLRQGWDGDRLINLTKNDPVQVSRPHVSIIGHITSSELRRYLTETEMANGFGNRILWACVRRSQLLPDGGDLPHWGQIVQRLHDALSFARKCARPVVRDEQARAIWHRVYGPLSEGKPGLLGALTSRAEAQVLRLSVVYAVMNGSAVVTADHLLAALAVWDYCEASARYLFGDATGDPVADRILTSIRAAGSGGLALSDISDLFDRHQKSGRIQAALSDLEETGMVDRRTEPTEGRPRVVYSSR